MTDRQTGYPSIDRPWKKYFTEETKSLSVPHKTVYEELKECSWRYQNNIALEYFGKKINYKSLFQNIDKTAKALKAAGVQKGEMVSVCLPNTPEAIYLVYAINRIGAIANMLDVRCGEKALKEALVDAKSKLLICLDSTADKFEKNLKETSIKEAVVVSPLNSLPALSQLIAKTFKKELRVKKSPIFMPWRQWVQKGIHYNGILDAEWEENTSAYVAYTGGTTGIPKGVIATNENIIAEFLMQSLHGHPVGVGDRIHMAAPIWTYYGLCNAANNCLCSGMTVILVPNPQNETLGKDIKTLRPTFIITVPVALYSIMNDKSLDGADLSFIRMLVVGADKLDETLEIQMNNWLKEHNAGIVVSKGYGMTEVMAASACTKIGADGVGSAGVPCPGVIISAFTETDGQYIECLQGEIGEIAICAPTIMKGYFGPAASETKDVIKQHVDGSLWAHTGDIGYIGADGRLYVEGRIKRMFTRNGYKIFPATIESCIMKHDDVKQTAVVNVQDNLNGNITKAFVVKKESSIIDNDMLKQELSQLTATELYDYEIPDIYEFVDELPLTGMGKIDFRALETIAKS